MNEVYSFHDEAMLSSYVQNHKIIRLFELDKLPHHLTDTYDFVSIPLNIGQLSFREKQLEYFPTEPDATEKFDVVINTSNTWPSRSWPTTSWQELANALTSRGLSVAVVGKDVVSKVDEMTKAAPPLDGCVNLVNKLSLDQTFYTIKKCGLFVTCQNGLSVLAGATDTQLIVLDQSIEWSKRAIFRNEDPHHRVEYVRGDCSLYCCSSFECPKPDLSAQFNCIPVYNRVMSAVFRALGLSA